MANALKAMGHVASALARRRRALQSLGISLCISSGIGIAALFGMRATRAAPQTSESPSRWYQAALEMKRRALGWGDQPYGAVLVMDDKVVGEGPSRVVLRNDPNAHAEREAIRDAQQRLGRAHLAGSSLYSTSRPCRECERAAALAGVNRMIHGAGLVDAGPPQP